jgi:cyclophilin family peptidyl-prolyl cis-trans isomerase
VRHTTAPDPEDRAVSAARTMAGLRRNYRKIPEVKVGKRDENIIVFMEISIGSKKVGRLEIELRRDLCPLTCENFRQLITGERGVVRETDEHGDSVVVPLHYKGSKLCRVVRDSHCQGGDIKNGDGTWSRSVYKRGPFPDENFILRHTGAGCLSMCNRGLDSNGSQFFLTMAAKPDWDERHVVFGVLRDRASLRTLFAIDQVGSQFGKPHQEVTISDCGQLWPPHHTQSKSKFTSTSGARKKAEYAEPEW